MRTPQFCLGGGDKFAQIFNLKLRSERIFKYEVRESYYNYIKVGLLYFMN